jgi:hypothetical protein
VLIALDFPAFDLPANAISGPLDMGKPDGLATEISNSAWRNRAIVEEK